MVFCHPLTTHDGMKNRIREACRVKTPGYVENNRNPIYFVFVTYDMYIFVAAQIAFLVMYGWIKIAIGVHVRMARHDAPERSVPVVTPSRPLLAGRNFVNRTSSILKGLKRKKFRI